MFETCTHNIAGVYYALSRCIGAIFLREKSN